MSENNQGMNNVPNRRPARRGHGPGAMMNVEHAKDFKGSMKRFISYIGAYKWRIVIVAILAIGSTLFNVLSPKVLGMATTALADGVVAGVAGTGGIDFDRIAVILLAVLTLYLVSAVFASMQGWIMAGVIQGLSFKLREDISRKINRVPLGYFEKSSIGDTLSRITNDVDLLSQSLNESVTTLITAVVSLIGTLIVMFLISPVMTLIALVSIPVSVVVIAVVVKHSQKYFKAQQNYLGAVNGYIEESFTGHHVMRAFNREAMSLEQFKENNEKLYESGWKARFLSGLMMPLMNVVQNASFVLVAVTGASFAMRGIITVGDVQAFVQYVRNLSQPVMQGAQLATQIQSMAAAAERVFEFLDAPEEEDLEGKTAKFPTEITDIDFEHVRFGYDPEKPVIKDFNAHVTKGQTIAIVGPTGAGKTTIVKLLMRFYDVDSGSIKINGVDIKNFSRAHLREAFGMVLQDAWLFNGSIRDNIRYGRLEASDDEVRTAADAAYADHFIRTLPEGYDTEINENASNISAGQRQLLTIARTILADNQVLILDEATSSVDTRTEERIQHAMDNLMMGRTSFVIAHRLSTIKNADLILVMNEGDIVEQGTHEELLEQKGRYFELYNSQFEEV